MSTGCELKGMQHASASILLSNPHSQTSVEAGETVSTERFLLQASAEVCAQLHQTIDPRSRYMCHSQAHALFAESHSRWDSCMRYDDSHPLGDSSGFIGSYLTQIIGAIAGCVELYL